MLLVFFAVWLALGFSSLTGYGKNAALEGVTAKALWLGGFSSVGKAPTSNTAVAASLINMTGSKAAGWTNGKLVVCRSITGGVTNILAKETFYIVGEVTNGFELALEESGTAIKVAGHELETGSTEFALLTELTGGGYKRIKTTWGTVKAGEVSDTAKELLKIPAGAEITDVGWWEGESTGKVIETQKLTTAEKYGSEGTYEITADSLEANTVA